MGMERKAKGGRIDPEKYGMIFCPYCKGSGKSFTDTEGIGVCKACGGFGLIIKKEERNSVDDHGGTVRLLR
jgi:rRNA maturation endonuclease Nob1